MSPVVVVVVVVVKVVVVVAVLWIGEIQQGNCIMGVS
jgi:hypothetical protein